MEWQNALDSMEHFRVFMNEQIDIRKIKHVNLAKILCMGESHLSQFLSGERGISGRKLLRMVKWVITNE